MSEAIGKLRKTAAAATPGEWKHGCLPGINRRDNRVYADARPDGDWLTVLECGDMAFEDALHIATFDPPTVTAMLDVIEAAEGWLGDDDQTPGHAVGEKKNVRKALARFHDLSGGAV